MAMNVGSSSSQDPEEMVDINTTPLIDVMLVLLIMLIITIPVQTNDVKLDMPQANAPPPTTQPQVVDIEVDFDGTILWNGNVVPNRQALVNDIRSVSMENPQPEFHIRPDRLAKYKYVAEVMAEAQRLGIQKIGIVGGQ